MHGATRFVLASLLVLVAMGCAGKKGPFEGKSAAELTALLDDPNPAVQSEAAYHLSLLGPQARAAVPSLILALKSPDTSVRQNAALALGALGPGAAEAVPALTAALADKEYSVRRQAADALGSIGPAARSALPELERMSRMPDPCKSGQDAIKKIRQK